MRCPHQRGTAHLAACEHGIPDPPAFMWRKLVPIQQPPVDRVVPDSEAGHGLAGSGSRRMMDHAAIGRPMPMITASTHVMTSCFQPERYKASSSVITSDPARTLAPRCELSAAMSFAVVRGSQRPIDVSRSARSPCRCCAPLLYGSRPVGDAVRS